MEGVVVRTKGNGVATMMPRTQLQLEIPPMPACWDSQEDWEGWCRLMALTYRQEYHTGRTLQQALHSYCLDCVPGVIKELIIKSGRCKEYSAG